MRVIEIQYKPHTKQTVIHNETARYRTIVCGRRFGKTVFAVNELVKRAALHPGEYWYVAPTYKQAKRIAWELFKKYASPVVLDWNQQELTGKLINGSILRVMGADNEDSLRGSGLDGIVFDEYADIKPNVWEKIVRPMLLDRSGWAIFMGTPKGKNHFYELFIKDEQFSDPTYRNEWGITPTIDPSFKSFRFKTADNPYIPAEEIDKARKEMNEENFRQEFEASFETYAGLIYKEFKDDNITRDMPKIDDTMHIYVGIDTGRTTAVSFVSLDQEDKIRVFDEIYNFDGLVQDIAAEIKKKLEYWGIDLHKPHFIIDSASQVKREYEAGGINIIDSQKDVLNSINLVRDRLKNKTLMFNHSCRSHIFEHRSYIWDEKPRQNSEHKPKKENDHSVNALQYVLNSIHFAKPIESKVTYEEFKRKDIFDDDYEKIEDELGVVWRGQSVIQTAYNEHDTDEYKVPTEDVVA